MSGSLDQFGKSLVGSGLFTADELMAFWAALAVDARPRDSETFSKLLVAQGKLTEFQARHVAAGSADPLVLGDYVLLDKIGAGGMGQVFKAQHKRLKRLAAVKLLPPDAMRDAASIKRFQREVEAAGRVSHPNVVQAHDAGEHRGRHYLVMEYVAGSDLASLVRRHGPLPVDHAVACVLQAARGLEHAHAKGLIHRDIKPANLLIDERGTVKVLDLGLARFEDVLGAGGDDGLTGTGNIMGTVDFMSPEQALDTKHADARADVYSLGCTLYFLLTAKKPYDADTVMKRLMAHRESPIPSLREARPEVPAAVDEVYGRMMAKRPEERLQTMEDVCRELEACMPEARSILGETSPSAPNKSQSASGSSSSNSGERLRAFLQGLPSGGTTSVGTPQIAITVGDDTQGSHNPAVHTESVRTLPSVVPAIEAKTKLTSATKRIKPAARRAAKRRRLMMIGGGAALALVAGIGLWKFNAKKIEEVGDHSVVAASVASPPPVAPRPPLAKAPFDAKLAKLYQAAWARHLGTQVQTKNPVGMTLALIAPGEFLMGTSDAEIQAAKEHAKTLTTAGEALKFDQFEQQGPQHPVRLSRPYRMSTTETTVAQFRGFVEATGYKTDVEASGQPTRVTRKSQRGFDYLTGEFDWRNPGRTPADDEAVVLVSRADAVAFCNWLSRTESLPEAYVKNNAGQWVLLDGAAGYRLPTEAEWEYACRAGTTTAWWWGDDERQSRSWENIDGTGNSAARNPANPFGLNEMAGNVMEWCDDLFAETYPSRELRIDPPPGAVGSRFVARGANFTSKPVTARSATRFGYVGPMDTIGFRVVRTIATPAGDVSSAAAAIDMTPVADAPGSPQTAPRIAKAPFDAKQAKTHQAAWAQYLTTKVEETNSLGMPMVLVPPSEFLMGTSDEEIAAALKYAEGQPSNVAYNYRQFSLCGPQHRVTLSRPFRIAEMETTVAQFRRFCEATSYVTAVEADGKPNRGLQLVGAREYVEVEGDYSWHDPGWKPLDAQPVVLVTWEDAIEFCNWLSRSERLPQAYVKDGVGRWVLMEGVVGYRLPTEAEWECACRAGTTSRFWWGDDEQGRQLREHLNCELSEVGRTMPNPLGLYDMGGNVSEWCQDTFRGPYPSAEHVFDPIEQSPDDRRVVRGGQYRTQTIVARSARRGGYEEASTTIGFRIVRTIGPPMEDLTSAAATNKTPVAHAPGSPNSTTAPNLDRACAEWVLSIGGKVTISRPATDGPKIEMEISDAAKLPSGIFALAGVNLIMSERVTGEDVARFSGLKELRVLNLEQTTLTGASLEPIGRLAELRELGFGTGINPTQMQFLSALEQLEALAIVAPITDDQAAFLANMPRLRSLKLSYSNVTDEGLREIVAQLPHLERLWISNSRRITEAATSSLREHAGLRDVNLNATPITDRSLDDLATIPNLELLYLQGTKVTAAGLAQLRRMAKLKRLEISLSLPIDAAVVEALRQAPALKALRINRVKPDDAIAEGLQRALPKCAIEWKPQSAAESESVDPPVEP